MVDLFRYVEHAFAVPVTTDAIDVTNESDFQTALAEAAQDGQGAEGPSAAERVRELADDFLAKHFTSPTVDPTSLGGAMDALAVAVSNLREVSARTVSRAIRDAFGKSAEEVVNSREFAADRELLQNSVLAVKLATGFDRADSTRLVRQLRVAAFLQTFTYSDGVELTRPLLDRLLDRPVRIPTQLLTAAATSALPPNPTPPPDNGDRERMLALRQERDRLQASYDALLAIPPRALQFASVTERKSEEAPVRQSVRDDEADQLFTRNSVTDSSILRLGSEARQAFLNEHADAMRSVGIDLAHSPVDAAIETVGRRIAQLNETVLPLEIPTAAKVFRVGGRLFAETASAVPLAGAPPVAMPDFSKAVTRPVGVGNLQVVRQELVGYRPGDISHIENVLEGELMRRGTRREELIETILTEETVTTQMEERDHQSTDRNELATETQKESGRQSSTSGDGMSASDYGRLVENSKTNYAQTVVSKSVESLTQQVRRQRVQRERTTFVERAQHVFDNSKGTGKVRGIYQWVDKRYSMRVLNYGKRLMYDVVVPEPAAFLVQALKNAVQPESFQLTKPLDPNLTPSQLNAGNYAWYAARYGVTGSVTPPPEVYAKTVSHPEAVVDVTRKVKAYGADVEPPFQTAFKLTVPDGYKAVSGYVQHVNVELLGAVPGATLEIIVGSGSRLRLDSPENPFLNVFFNMSGETGEIPITVRTFAKVVGLSYAVALVCQRTDGAYAQWQLKTHAAIVSGYLRQLADYEDRLSRYVAAVRTQLALAGNYAHDPTVTQEELQRAFIFLLLGEHPPAWFPTPVPAPLPPAVTLPDPVAVKKWGAMVAFFERAFEWENLMYTCYPYYWGRPQRWEEMLLTQDADPQFEAFLKSGAARVVVPVRPGFEAAMAHYQETGDVWMGEEIPDMYGDNYLSIIAEIKAANFAPGEEVCIEQWEVTLPTTLDPAQGRRQPPDVDTDSLPAVRELVRGGSAGGRAAADDLVLRDAITPPQLRSLQVCPPRSAGRAARLAVGATVHSRLSGAVRPAEGTRAGLPG